MVEDNDDRLTSCLQLSYSDRIRIDRPTNPGAKPQLHKAHKCGEIGWNRPGIKPEPRPNPNRILVGFLLTIRP
jgi:hypothetical protein